MFGSSVNLGWGGGYAWLLPLAMVDLGLRGVALWKAARSNKNWWFIALLVINSVGILPIVYLVFFDKKEGKVESIIKSVKKKAKK